MNYPIITNKSVKKNKTIRKVQKTNKKKYLKIRSKYPKACISKIIVENGYVNMSNNENVSMKTVELSKLLNAIHENGLTCMSGNGFSTYEKLVSVIESSVKNKVLIINGLECDPGLIHDEWLIKNMSDEIVIGSKLIAKMINTADVIFAVKEINSNSLEGISVRILPN